MHFKDRTEAGRKLAAALQGYCSSDCVVYALPRGGIVVAVEIVRALNVPLDVVIPRKIGHPLSPEYAIAAVTDHGVVAANEEEVKTFDPRWFESAVAAEKQEAHRRRSSYMEGRESYAATNKNAILVDDGIATGLTMKAAILDIKSQSPASVVVAIPVVPASTAQELLEIVDAVVAIEISEYYLGAVGLYYTEFPQTTDTEVNQLLETVNPRRLAHK